MEEVNSFRFLGITNTEKLCLSSHIITLVNYRHKLQKRFHLLTRNITNWTRTGRFCSGRLKPTRTSLVPSTEWHWWGETSAQGPEDTRRSHSLFTLLPSDRRYRSICCCTNRRDSSFTPANKSTVSWKNALMYFLHGFNVLNYVKELIPLSSLTHSRLSIMHLRLYVWSTCVFPADDEWQDTFPVH